MNITSIRKLKSLEQRAAQLRRRGGDWKPDTVIICEDGDGVRATVHFWDGVNGSGSPAELEAHPERQRSIEFSAATVEEARAAVMAFCRDFERDHGLTEHLDPLFIDCTFDLSDEGRRQAWEQRGGTALEYMAEENGRTLLEELTEQGIDATVPPWNDILRWRGELE